MEWQVNENGGLGDVRRDCWRNIAITLKTHCLGWAAVNEC